jgi:1-acyl-sn-glycerol-3-phosphate acyltransferase
MKRAARPVVAALMRLAPVTLLRSVGAGARVVVWVTGHSSNVRTRDAAAGAAKTRLFEAFESGFSAARVADLVRWRDPSVVARLKHGPAIVVIWHVGPTTSVILPALMRAGVPALAVVFRAGAVRAVPGIDFASAWDAPFRTMRAAVRRIRAGGVVVIAVDATTGTHTPYVEAGQRRIRFRRGAFMLARMTGAPIVPAAAMWTSRGTPLTIVTGDPIVPPAAPSVDFERDAAQALADWLERFLIQSPERLRDALSSTD